MKTVTVVLFGLLITLVGVLTSAEVGSNGEVTGAGFTSSIKTSSVEKELSSAISFKASRHVTFYQESYFEKTKASL